MDAARRVGAAAGRLVLLFVLLASPCAARQQQAATPPAGPREAQTPAAATATPGARAGDEAGKADANAPGGSITGRVIGDGGEPLPYAAVYAASRNSGTPTFSTPPTATTDAEGGFRLDGLAPNVYSITAVLPGYVTDPEALAASAYSYFRVGDTATLRLLKGGVVTGTVTEASGDPVVGISVRALRVRDAEGRPVPPTQSFGFTRDFRTDDRGVYRIYGLAPGSYLVSTGDPQFGGLVPSAHAGYAPTFYPSATRDTAVEVSVRGGQETGNIDIRFRAEYGQRITGTVAVPPTQAGAPPPSVMVTLRHVGSGMYAGNAWVEGGVGLPEGARPFSFNSVPDGEYEVSAQVNTREGSGSVSPPSRVNVRGVDVTGLKLVPVPYASLSGSLLVERPAEELRALPDCKERPAQTLPQEVVVSARRDQPPPQPGSAPRMFARQEVAPDASGAFTIRNLEQGRYRLDARPVDEHFYVRAIQPPATATATATPARPARAQTPAAATTTQPERDYVELKSGQQLSGLSVRVAPGAASLSGRLAAQDETTPLPPFSQLRVYLVPGERERAEDLLRHAEARPSAEGTFAFRNLAPGRYLLVARPVFDTPNAAPRPPFWDAAERARLRREAEAANVAVELQPCQRTTDFTLRFK